MSAKIGRNDPCHCGSGKKYKKCHLATDEQQAAAKYKAALEALPQVTPSETEPAPDTLHVSQKTEALASLETTEGNAFQIFQREDANVFLLSLEEAKSWLPVLDEALVAEGLGAQDTPAELFERVGKPVLGRMAKSIFNPERLKLLEQDLEKYRDQRFDNGDQESAGYATGAILAIQGEPDPVQNPFLLYLCYCSIMKYAPQELGEAGAQS